ncbi:MULTISPECIES: hypothetical protein [unclassified Streptococcus]|uniref:hypothetical protein n=1 Tax=unclassified Streptococcus TaxID=2608887 RepID=UPI001072B63B|nr:MULTISPECIES: hypothetical protein [unclassified Streptococcus]MBF0787078.1 hypothetical protein [Streptococcus sp. 19428wC2_LYSM12]MCQ9211364.1 hypothetical protein [Streptococcus sp. B01]MCQ9214676.1 hypothetical protein [Streptococcus sp. O1]TFV05966.1 hypothetical protein E4T79_04090 [Streptococcus sp. LYSM12]
MRFTQEDFIADYSFFRGHSIFEQVTEEEEFVWNKGESVDKVSPLVEEIFEIFSVSRISECSQTPYLIHKSYPSARSFYLQECFICNGGNEFLYKNEVSDKYQVVYCQNNDVSFEKGDILIKTGKMKYDLYKSIRKTLMLLELGHIVYNIHLVLSKFDFKINRIKMDTNYTLISLENGSVFTPALTLKALHQLYVLRTSGPYLKRIIDFNRQINAHYLFKTNIQEAFRCLFNVEYDSTIIRMYIFRNNGVDGFCYENITLSYSILNKVYQYIDFRSASQYTLFAIKREFHKIFEQYIVFLGYIAQECCLHNSCYGRYNRPVKQVLPVKVWESFFADDCRQYYPFYGIITGNI